MRFLLGGEVQEMTNIRQVGDQLEISYDWNTASLGRGPYALAVEVATKNDPNWASVERRVTTYSLTGTPTQIGRPPDRPILKSPYNWYLKDASGAAASIELCVYPSSDPEGDPVQYKFQILDQIGNPTTSSAWTRSTCWSPTLSPGIYGWKVVASDGTNQSDWSQDIWNFSVASGGVSIDSFALYQPNTNETHICVSVPYGGIQAPDVYAWLNKAADGSESEEWRLLDHYGPNTTPDCTQSSLHGFWIRSPEYVTGTHALRITAIKRDSGSSATRNESYTIAYMRPNSPQPVRPSTYADNGVFYNTPTVTFEWTAALRADGYQVQASTNADLWNDPSPVLSIQVPGTATT